MGDKERRREQNRLAQRRFRQKHGRQRPSEQRSYSLNHTLSSRTSETAPFSESYNAPCLDNVMSVPSTGLDGSAIPGAGGVLDVNTAAFGGIDESWMAGWELDSATSMSSTPASSHADTFEHDRLQYPSNDYDPFRPDIGTDDRHGGSPIMCHNDQFRPSTLHIAVQKGNCRVLRLLLEHGADCDSKDTAGFTPLICATIRGYDDMVCLLLLHGAGIGHVDNSHRSALHWAIICRRERLLQKLLKHCGNDDALINSSTIEGRTALYIAVENGFDEAVELLLEHRAKLD